MGAKFLIALAALMVTMSMFAIAANNCTYEGKEYEHREATWIDGNCHMCWDGEWQRMPYNPPKERCKGKL